MAPPTPKILDLMITEIDVDEQKIRDIPEDDAFSEFCESIASKGLLQPVGVTEKPDGRYQLRWGLRRTLAHRRLNRPTIKAILYDGPEDSVKGLAIVENIHRTQMTMEEEVDCVVHLITAEQKTPEQVASIMSKSRAWVCNRMMIPNLPTFLREPLLAGHLPISHIEVITKVPDEGARRYLAQQSIVQQWNVSALKQIADCYMGPTPQPEPTLSGTGGINPNSPVAPFLYTCEVCQQKGTLEKFTLVRVHRDGEGCRADSNRSDQPSSSNDGMVSRKHRPRRTSDKSDDRKDQT